MKIRIEYCWCPETGGDFEHRSNGAVGRVTELDFGHVSKVEEFANVLLTLADEFMRPTQSVIAECAAQVANEHSPSLRWERFWKSTPESWRRELLKEITDALEKVEGGDTDVA